MLIQANHVSGLLDISSKEQLGGVEDVEPIRLLLEPGQIVQIDDRYRRLASITGAINNGLLTLISYGSAEPGGTVVQAELDEVRDIVINLSTTSFQVVLDGRGNTITTGIKCSSRIAFNATIEEVTLLADQIGSIQIDIWKNNYPGYPPTVANSITGSTPPSIVSAIKSTDLILLGWNKTLVAGDILRFNVDSATNITNVSLIVRYLRT
ncbi:MAG: hypothetical protein AABY32_04250 [Nanoarchaeota archaeon]